MNTGQDQFLQFILDRAQEGRQDEARALLDESFARQAVGTMNSDYLREFGPRLMALLRPESVAEVAGIMAQFGGRHAQDE